MFSQMVVYFDGDDLPSIESVKQITKTQQIHKRKPATLHIKYLVSLDPPTSVPTTFSGCNVNNTKDINENLGKLSTIIPKLEFREILVGGFPLKKKTTIWGNSPPAVNWSL